MYAVSYLGQLRRESELSYEAPYLGPEGGLHR